jgi:hypothetical protein
MESTDLVLRLHGAAGALALVAFWTAAALRKGGPRHRLAGRVHQWAMLAVIATAAVLFGDRVAGGHLVGASFLGYLLVLIVTTTWLGWRAPRDRHRPQAYLGRTYRVLTVLNPLAATFVLGLGLVRGVPLLAAFSIVGLLVGADMWRRRAQIPGEARWWVREHYTAMLGSGAALHVAFVAAGLPRLLPGIERSPWYVAGWLLPVASSVLAQVWLDRRHRGGGTRAVLAGRA